MRLQYHFVDKSTGVGVIDKTVGLLQAVAERPRNLNELIAATGIPRPTAHRLAVALEAHGILDRDEAGRFRLGIRLHEWASHVDPLLDAARRAVAALTAETGLSSQVYVRRGDERLCIASAEPASGLRDTVPSGTLLPLTAGSGAQVLVAWLPTAERHALTGTFSEATLKNVRGRGWAHSVGQREPGVASISAPVRDGDGRVIAAISLSGPADRLAKASPPLVRAVLRAADHLT